MNFDLNKLMQDPAFAVGIGLLGGASPRNQPLLTAYQLLNEQSAAKREQERQLAQRDIQQQQLGMQQKRLTLDEQEAGSMDRYRNAQIEVSRANTERLAEQNKLSAAKLARMEANAKLFEKMFGSGMGGMLPQPAQTPSAAPDDAPTGKYGTPKQILMNLKQVESGGNPLALGPDIGGGVRAQGAFQFLPDTVKMLHAQGIKFDPFKEQEAEDAADFYIQSLVKKHGGDYSKALAEYGGFKAKDPTNYLTKVLKGSPESTARLNAQNNNAQAMQQRYQQITPTMLPNVTMDEDGFKFGMTPSFEPARIGMEAQRLDLEQRKAAADYGPGGFKQQESARDNERVRIQREAEQRAAEKARIDRENAERERRQTKAQDTAQVQTNLQAINSTRGAVRELLGDKHLPAVTGRGGLMPKAMAQAIYPEWGNTIAKMEQVSSTQIIDMLQNIRKNAPTGASGFGQFQQFEKEMFQAAQGLDRAKTAKEYRAALARLDKVLQGYETATKNIYSQTYGEAAPPAFEGPQAPTGKLPQGWKVERTK